MFLVNPLRLFENTDCEQGACLAVYFLWPRGASPAFEDKNNSGRMRVTSLICSGKFSKMVQQLPKYGPKESPLLKGGHRPAGRRLLFPHDDYYCFVHH